MSESDGINEQFKTGTQMEWVARINNIRSRVIEIVNIKSYTDLFYDIMK
ncbi:MAG: hypothetical protein DBX38_01770 [Eubacteriales Family XIII. Incertae Sedis bacterium]|nr:MAG: hypothetical protein DBX38_01770 [Clostridiales Family XIII bacterium]